MLCPTFRNLVGALLLSSGGLAVAAAPGLVAEKPAEGVSIKIDTGFMVAYEDVIPGTDVKFQMVPVPGGVFKFGSRDNEEGRNDDEGPQTEVELPPFWIAKYELTWAEYKQFMKLNDTYARIKQLRTQASPGSTVADEVVQVLATKPELQRAVENPATYVDGVTAPTPLYDPSTTYESGDDPRQPALTMTPYAARQYTKWLSTITGTDYRLLTEAEWEYAARAGDTGPWPGDGTSDSLSDYAWFTDNADYATHRVGEKEPNSFGLYDMLGNVAELVVDGYDENGYVHLEGRDHVSWAEAIAWPTKAYPRVARGGYFDATAEECRYASRMPTDDKGWKVEDPNLPRSPWWFADFPASGIGMRLARSLEPLTPDLKHKFWEIDHPEIARDVAERLREGRGKLGPVSKELPAIEAQLASPEVAKLLDGTK